MQRTTGFKQWVAFFTLGGFCWGTSYFWIKIAVAEIGPFTLVALRVTLATVAIWAWVLVQKIPLSAPTKEIGLMALLGITNLALPFTLISWGETRIDSGLTGLLTATMPLFTTLIAHCFIANDRITVPKTIGVVLGFSGVGILFIRDLGPGEISFNLWGQAAVIGAALCYASSTVYNRRFLQGQHPIAITAFALPFAAATMWLLAPLVEAPFTLPRLPLTWIATAWLALIGTALAYPLVFFLVHTWGPTRTSLVAYVIPVTALTLGVIVLQEVFDWRLALGGLLIIMGIATVNWRTWLPGLWRVCAPKSPFPFPVK
ncbi:MAG: DMT family transporter [Anaerolineales bacterium]|jgi:drug/metabolite transporter (DMT)-like permease|nr:DMT family transporter [Anaerolineales bacterium]MDP7544730.1 DMT family transporter [Anaerolineales bacterium]MDP7643251.1 DMT family transporter [Anaerolineales bacterium]HJN40894.1 DMT family transporter [Anaerolineales bacterium]